MCATQCLLAVSQLKRLCPNVAENHLSGGAGYLFLVKMLMADSYSNETIEE